MSQSISIRSGTSHLSGLKRLHETFKLSLRATVHRRATRRWLTLLNSHPLFADLAAAQPRLIRKIFRPYLSNTMRCAQRVSLLEQHYRFIFSQGLGPLSVRAAQAAVTLASISGKSGQAYQVRLHAIDPMEREGELVLQLMQDEQLIYSCAFSFFRGEQGMLLGVGCLQGPKGADSLQLIKDATRELHGLRPKHMMIKLLSQLGHAHGCVELRLVCNANRTVCGASRQGKVHADYDALWCELAATPGANGDYRLPCAAIEAPDLEAIASKKRSEARKRHDTLVALGSAIAAALRAPCVEAVPLPAPLSSAAPWVAQRADADEYALA